MRNCLIFACLAALAWTTALPAQEFRGAIAGSILDPAGSVIVGARVSLVEINTDAKAEATSDGGGRYSFPLLLAGDYEITARANGFRDAVRKGIHLGAGERPLIEIQMTVGEAQQTIEVTADAPLIISDNASIGQVLTTKEVEDLPSNGGTPMAMVALSPGIVQTNNPSQIMPYTSGGAAAFSFAGMPNQTNELLTDGVPNTTWDGRLAYSPPRNAVQEVRTKVFDTDAAYGRTAGGTANTILKSGSNSVKGVANWNNQPNTMTANTFFNNKGKIRRPVTNFNQGGITVGGPLYIPKVYDGRNKVFWLFAFDDLQSKSPNNALMTVPTAALREGDFSKLQAVNGTVIYDPYSAVQQDGIIVRSPFPGNKIPAERLNPIALKYVSLFPEPNTSNPARKDDYQNFGNNATTKDTFSNEFGRLDFNLSDNLRTYFNVRHTNYFQDRNNYFENMATGNTLRRENWGASLDQVYAVNANNVLNLRLNYTRMYESSGVSSAGFDPTAIGFPSYIASNSQYLQLPTMTFSGNSGFPTLGGSGSNVMPSQSMQAFASWSTVIRGHNVKTGVDLRQYRLNYIAPGNSVGTFGFASNYWVRGRSDASDVVQMGQDWAAFLMGLPYTGASSYDITAASMFYSYYAGAFIQDDWRVSRSLTLNLGLRYDHDFPYREKWGRSSNGFDFDAESPLNAAASAAYDRNPMDLIAAGAFNVRGGLTFASPKDNALFKNDSHMISPRAGFAFVPDWLKGAVIRGGVGMFVAPVTISQMVYNSTFSSLPLLAQEGYSQTTPLQASLDGYLTPYGTLSDPYPGGQILQPAGSSKGLLTYAGQGITFLNPDVTSPYAVRWSLGIQKQITPNLKAEVLYIGSRGVDLPIGYTQLNGIPRKYLSTSPFRDQALITTLSRSVPNPFYGLDTSVKSSTADSVAQLIVPYPQFPNYSSTIVASGTASVTEYNVNKGSSEFHGFNLQITKRFSKGLQLTVGAMHSRVFDATSWLNASDTEPEHRVSVFDHPNRLTVTTLYDLPVGKGRALNIGQNWLNLIAGGWRLSGTYIFQTGQPIVWSGSTDYVYLGADLDNRNREVNKPSFNTAAFATKSSEQLQYHLRTFASTFMNLRQDGINDVNGSIMKDFRLDEQGRSLQIRCDAFNAINHPTFGSPNTTTTSSTFGYITSQANRPRMIQFGARLAF